MKTLASMGMNVQEELSEQVHSLIFCIFLNFFQRMRLRCMWFGRLRMTQSRLQCCTPQQDLHSSQQRKEEVRSLWIMGHLNVSSMFTESNSQAFKVGKSTVSKLCVCFSIEHSFISSFLCQLHFCCFFCFPILKKYVSITCPKLLQIDADVHVYYTLERKGRHSMEHLLLHCLMDCYSIQLWQ